MTEPVSSTGAAGAALVAIASSLAGQQWHPLATIVFAAAVGAFVSLGEVQTSTKSEAVRYMLRYVLMAVAVASGIAYLIETYTGLPSAEMLALVAFFIGWTGNRWPALKATLLTALQSLIGRRGGGGL